MNEKKYLSKDTLKELYLYVENIRGINNGDANRTFVKIKDFFNFSDEKSENIEKLFDEISTKEKSERLNAELEVLENKIELKDIVPQIFIEKAYSYYSYKKSQGINKVLKKIYNDDINILNELHKYITNHKAIEKDNDSLHDIYYQLLKAKKTNKNELNKKEVLNNIKSFKIRDNIKKIPLNASEISMVYKKINAYVSLFQNNVELYQFIINDLKEVIAENIIVKEFFENKLSKFPDEVKEIYRKNNEISKEVELIEDKVLSKYEMNINSDFLVAKYNLNTKKANELVAVFYSALFQHYASQYTLEEKYYVYGKGLSISSSENDINDIKKSANDLKKHIPNMFKYIVDSKFEIHYPSDSLKDCFIKLIKDAEVTIEKDYLSKILPEKHKNNKPIKV